MRDLPDTRVERTRAVGDVVAPRERGPQPESIEAAVLSCVEPTRMVGADRGALEREVDRG